jgi:DNA-binding transcriptional ArsR family regulator
MKSRPKASKTPRVKPVRVDPPVQPEVDYKDFAARLKALADPDRLRIVSCLFREPKNVSELAHDLGEQLVKISHHLGVLRHARVVQTEKQGKFVVYRLDPEITTAIMEHAHTVQTEKSKFASHRVDAGASEESSEAKSVDLGCCRFELPKS